MKKAILLVSHGSFSVQARRETAVLSRILKKKNNSLIFEYAFLEINHPNIPEGIWRCAKKGAGEITILLNFLSSGVHVLSDITGLVRKAKRKFPKVSFFISPPIGLHEKIPNLFMDYIRHCHRLKKI